MASGGRRDENEAIPVLEVDVIQLQREHQTLVSDAQFHRWAVQDLNDRHQRLEERHQRLEERHQRLEDRHQRQEDRHQLLEDRHQVLEDRHQVLEDRHQVLEDRHRVLEDHHRVLEDQHEEMADQHRRQNTSMTAFKYISIGLLFILLLERISHFDVHISGSLVLVVVSIIYLICRN